MSDEYISLKQLAGELGMDRSHARKYVLNLGVTPAKRRTRESGGQMTLPVSAQEAEFIRHTREEQGLLDSQKPVASENGFFYAIQLVPEFAPGRVKLGFADIQPRIIAGTYAARTTSCGLVGQAIVLGGLPLARAEAGDINRSPCPGTQKLNFGFRARTPAVSRPERKAPAKRGLRYSTCWENSNPSCCEVCFVSLSFPC
jgi:hypothetical protein